MRLGRKRTFRGNMMKAVFKYLKGYHVREGKIILICLKRTKPGLTRRSYRAGLGSPSRGIQYKLQWTQQGSVTPPHPLLLPYQQVEASDGRPETESQIPALRGSWPRESLRSYPSLWFWDSTWVGRGRNANYISMLPYDGKPQNPSKLHNPK